MSASLVKRLALVMDYRDAEHVIVMRRRGALLLLALNVVFFLGMAGYFLFLRHAYMDAYGDLGDFGFFMNSLLPLAMGMFFLAMWSVGRFLLALWPMKIKSERLYRFARTSKWFGIALEPYQVKLARRFYAAVGRPSRSNDVLATQVEAFLEQHTEFTPVFSRSFVDAMVAEIETPGSGFGGEVCGGLMKASLSGKKLIDEEELADMARISWKRFRVRVFLATIFWPMFMAFGAFVAALLSTEFRILGAA